MFLIKTPNLLFLIINDGKIKKSNAMKYIIKGILGSILINIS